MPNTLRLRAACAFLFSILLALSTAGQTPRPNGPRELEPAPPLTRELAGAEIHRYGFELRRDELFKVKVEQKGIDVLLLLYDASGAEVARMDSPNGSEGFEVLTFVADSAGQFLLEVKSLDEKAGKGAYIIEREPPKTASAEERAQAMAERELQSKRDRLSVLIDEVNKSINATYPSTPPAEFQKALDNAAEGVALAQSVKLLDYESLFLFQTARLYEDKGDGRKAVEYYEKTLQNIDNSDKETKARLKFMQTTSFRRMGRIHENDLDNKEEAVKLFNRGLSLYQEGEEDKEKGLLLRLLGDSLRGLKFYPQAEESYLKAVKVFQNLKLQLEIGVTTGELGRLYSDMNDRPADAIRNLLDSERMLEGSPADSEYQNTRLYNLGYIYRLYDRLHDYEKANIYRNKVKELEAKTKDRHVVFANKLLFAVTLEGEGKLEEALKQNQEAFNYAETLDNDEKTTAQSVVLQRMVRLYLKLGKIDEAIADIERAVNLVKDRSDHTHLASLFESFGDDLFNRRAFDLAATYYSTAVHILADKEKRPKQVNFEQFAGVQNKWAKAQFVKGEKSAAMINFRTSLLVQMSLHQQTHLADMLEDRMDIFAKEGQGRLAIFFGKQSILLKQEMRRVIKSFPVDTQKSFLKGSRETYEKLVALLLQEKRLGEAVQVINLYQDEEFYDFDDRGRASNRTISFTERERSYLAELQRLQSSLHASREKFVNNPDFNKLDDSLKRLEADFAKPADEKDAPPAVPELADARAVVAGLSEATGQKTAALYTIVGENKFHLILVSPNGEAKSFESSITAEDLNEKMMDFYALLQSPRYDPRPLGRELYNLILKPAEADLKRSGAQTLMWQLDGSLRYVPMAALWDGERYLVERYQNVVFTRSNREQLTRAISPSWAGAGFGSSRARTVDLSGDKFNFVALPGVLAELRSIFRTSGKADGILDGDVLFDEGFTRDAFFEAMKRRRPLVHISSHFAFRPGDDSRSFLLLGDGTALTLNEMKRQENLFAGVEMLTLSACNTAATRPDAGGKEIDGFAELAQRLGAGAVMATLWQVSDGSTPWLMQEFYATRQGKVRATKAEALRRAQLALLNGTADAKLFPDVPKGDPSFGVKVIITQGPPKQTPAPSRSDTVYVSELKAPLFEHDLERKPFAHPYYWSPFVLYGNWR